MITATPYLDSDHPAIIAFAREATHGATSDRGLFDELPLDRILDDFRTFYGVGDMSAVRDNAFH